MKTNWEQKQRERWLQGDWEIVGPEGALVLGKRRSRGTGRDATIYLYIMACLSSSFHCVFVKGKPKDVVIPPAIHNTCILSNICGSDERNNLYSLFIIKDSIFQRTERQRDREKKRNIGLLYELNLYKKRERKKCLDYAFWLEWKERSYKPGDLKAVWWAEIEVFVVLFEMSKGCKPLKTWPPLEEEPDAAPTTTSYTLLLLG